MRTRALILPLVAVFALAGCSAAEQPDPAPAATTDAPVAAESTEPTPTNDARAVPEVCTAIDPAPGSTLEGAAFGECVSQALMSFGSGRMHLSMESEGEVEFSYDPDYSFQGTMAGPAGEMSMVFLDGEMWIDTGSGPVKGDLEAADTETQMVGLVAELYRQFSDVRETAKLIGSQPTWLVAPERESVALPGGESVDALKITSAGAFSWNEIPIDEFVLWYGDDWTPVGTQASINQFGVSATQSQRFYDLGTPVTITPPATP